MTAIIAPDPELMRPEVVASLAVSAPAVLTAPGALESPVSGRQIVVEVLDSRGRILARSLTLGARLLPEDRLAHEALVAGRSGFFRTSGPSRNSHRPCRGHRRRRFRCGSGSCEPRHRRDRGRRNMAEQSSERGRGSRRYMPGSAVATTRREPQRDR